MASNHDLTSVMLLGAGIFRILLINCGVGLMPSSVTMKLRKLTYLRPNWNFLRLKVQPSLEDLVKKSQVLKTLFFKLST